MYSLSYSFHNGLSQDIEYSFLCCTVGPRCLSILYVIVCICSSGTSSPSLCPTPPRLALPPPFSVGPVFFVQAFGFGTQTAMVSGDAVLLPGKLQPTSLHSSLPCRPGQEWTVATSDSWESSTASVCMAPRLPLCFHTRGEG